MPAPISSSERPFGTSMSAVSAEPPNTRRSISATTCPPTPAAAAIAPRSLQLADVPLPVAEAQRVRDVALALRDGQHGRRIQPAAEQHNCVLAAHRPSDYDGSGCRQTMGAAGGRRERCGARRRARDSGRRGDRRQPRARPGRRSARPRSGSTAPSSQQIAARAAKGQTNCLVVVRDGKLAGEWYFNGTGPNTTQDVYSATKSVASTLVGIAQDDGASAHRRERVAVDSASGAGMRREPSRCATC